MSNNPNQPPSPLVSPLALAAETHAAVAETGEAPVIDTGLVCFIMLAQFMEMPVDADQIRHKLGKPGELFDDTDLLRVAKEMEIKARLSESSWERLDKMPLPAIAKRPDGSGDVAFTPDAHFTGTATFDYVMADAQGAQSTATVSVDVTAPPVATDAVAQIAEDGSVDWSLSVDGDVLFTPDANFNGTATFDYTVSDGNGGTATQTVSIDVTAVNDAPDTVADTASVAEDASVTILATDLLSNDSDAEGSALTLDSVSNATGGTVSLNVDGDVVFTPTADFNGAATFDYTVSDDNGGSSTVTVSENLAPVAADDVTWTPEGTAFVIDDAALLANDSDPVALI